MVLINTCNTYVMLVAYINSLYHQTLTGAVALSNAHFGQGNGPTFAINCAGNEDSLFQCPIVNILSYNYYYYYYYCSHSDDAGLRCQGNIYFTVLLIDFQFDYAAHRKL